MQHDPFSWRIRDGDFVYSEKKSVGAAGHMNRALNEWINGLSDEDRERFVDTLFRMVSATGVDTFTELSADWRHYTHVLFRAMRDLDPDSKKIMRQIIRELALLTVKKIKLSVGPQRIKSRLIHSSEAKRKKETEAAM